MAEEIEALIATDIKGGGLSGDRLHAIFKYDSLDTPFAVALPPEKLCHLVSVCAKLIALDEDGLGVGHAVQTLTLRRAAVAKAGDGAIALSLEQEGGGRLTWALPPQEAMLLLKKLAIALEIAGPKASPPSGSERLAGSTTGQ